MAIASIAVYDWPESWPDLLPFLLKLIDDQGDMNVGKKWCVHALINPVTFCFVILNIFFSWFIGVIVILDAFFL